MRVVFTTLAVQEIEDANQYYELEYAGLGDQFVAEVHKAALRVVAYPRA